jgi:hypothetical protein
MGDFDLSINMSLVYPQFFIPLHNSVNNSISLIRINQKYF